MQELSLASRYQGLSKEQAEVGLYRRLFSGEIFGNSSRKSIIMFWTPSPSVYYYFVTVLIYIVPAHRLFSLLATSVFIKFSVQGKKDSIDGTSSSDFLLCSKRAEYRLLDINLKMNHIEMWINLTRLYV